MTKLATWQCTCGRYAELECDWPAPTGTCGKPVCVSCARRIGGHDYCPFHRGDPPEVARAKEEAAARLPDALDLGRIEAENAARIFGLKRKAQ